ncbi:hypothetical protein PsorP6_010301 [Peronosclerospora sorghi]|uniref:Uncharacterized protein n=1 Tax=Peronosclerospora sorghi TaxID=230839 RepID=A0ACC0VXV2_9STRA|nr:hypothetical protein PsorP6_010301 [Peronosclerospora sorghi]
MKNTPSPQDFMNGMMAIVQRQQKIIEEMRKQRQVPREITVKGAEMPKYFGRIDESLDLYFFQAQKYCQSQNIDIWTTAILTTQFC